MAGFSFPKRKQVQEVKPSEIVVSRTFNDGNYESTRIELRIPMNTMDSTDVIFDMTLNKIHDLRDRQLKK